MSYTEIRGLLKLNRAGLALQRRSADDCDVDVVYQSPTQRVTLVHFYGGCSMVFSSDIVTEQCRAWIDSEVAIEGGEIVLTGGGEIGPPEWN